MLSGTLSRAKPQRISMQRPESLRSERPPHAYSKAAGVRFWGFRGPLGAWLCIWGALAMITSAPFDDWWHNAYGLDVKVLSPPHLVLALGFTTIQLGALLMVLAHQNRDPARSKGLAWLAAYAAGVLVVNTTIMAFEYLAFPNDGHNALYYQIAAGILPILLVAAHRSVGLAWPATAVALVYMGITAAMIWLLQLFPAQAKLAPIYNPVTHMVPPPFPLLLVVPAVAIDWVLRRRAPSNDWLRAPIVAATFLGVFLAVQWFFTAFLISPASENFIFGAQRWDYNSRVGPWAHQFWDIEESPLTLGALGIAAIIAVASTRLGLWWGNWLARAQR